MKKEEAKRRLQEECDKRGLSVGMAHYDYFMTLIDAMVEVLTTAIEEATEKKK